MAQPLPLQDKISQGSTRSNRYRAKKAQFGNGYSQRIKDGINNKIRTLEVVWQHLLESEMQTVETAFDVNEGVDVFTYIPFGESIEQQFIQDVDSTLDIVPTGGATYTISVILEQVYE